ncbi:MAG: tetratricopeptide repeat protein, partial [Thermodesulfobacteriota bacterium]|nr:tetratricopeptide repeat protein [Thermodesulfobacteriota bacterium]
RNKVWTSPVKLWTDCAGKSPNKARVHGNLGKALLDTGRYEEAAHEFETSLKIDPSLLGAYNNLAVIYIDHLKQYGKAEKHLQEAIKRNPSYPSAYLNLGVIALNKRQIFKAIPYFQKTLALDPKNLGAHYNLAACYVNLRDFAQALQVLDQGLAFWPASHRLYLLRGRVHYMAKERDKARNDLEKAYSLAPSDPEVRHYFNALR